MLRTTKVVASDLWSISSSSGEHARRGRERSISRLFLTHLHSDHVIQIPDLLLTGWLGTGGPGSGRLVPFTAWGPEGTNAMMGHLQEAFAFDIHMRGPIDGCFRDGSPVG